MAKTIGERLRELRKIVQLHTSWFTVALLGKEAISDAELRELEKYGKLPLDESLDFVKTSYVLGRLQAVRKSGDYKKLNYEEAVSETEKASLTSLEDYALEYAKLHAGDGLKNLSEDIAAGAFDLLKEAVHTAVSEASVRGIVKDKTALALTEKQPYQKLASTLASTLKSASSRDWKRVAATELHRAKQAGTAQAIVNKIGPYKYSDGPDSLVRIIPNLDTCPDCASNYLDDSGQPKTFPLSQLLQAGSNADPGVVHKRKGGLHGHWKATLPPLHPGCGCKVAYAPSGPLKKAVDTGSTSAVVKPPGPPQPAAAPSVGSIPGVPAPGNEAGPGRPSGASSTLADPDSGPDKQMVDCPFDGGDECKRNGGNGAKTHEAGGAIMRLHQEAREKGAAVTNDAAASAMDAEDRAKADAYSAYPPADAKVLADIGNNDIVEEKSSTSALNPDEQQTNPTGITGASKVRLKDNGWAWKKDGQFLLDGGRNPGGSFGSNPVGKMHEHEAAMYDYSVSMGISGAVAPTTTRSDNSGKSVSMQAHIENAVNVGNYLQSTATESSSKNTYQALLDRVPDAHKGRVKEKLDSIVSLGLTSNSADDHWDNLMCTPDADGNILDVHKIDNGLSFSNSFVNTQNSALKSAAKNSPDGMFHTPQPLLERYKSGSLGDKKKALGGRLSDWQVGQQFLREKYMAYLEELDGGIDPERFLTTFVTKGDIDYPRYMSPVATSASAKTLEEGQPKPQALDFDKSWGSSMEEVDMRFADKESSGQLPHQMFESFAMKWMKDKAGDESDPHHQDAKELLELGVLMPTGYKDPTAAQDNQRSSRRFGASKLNTMHDPAAARRHGVHKKYQESLRAEYPPSRDQLLNRASKIPKSARASSTADDTSSAGTAPMTGPDRSQDSARKGDPLYLDLTKSWTWL